MQVMSVRAAVKFDGTVNSYAFSNGQLAGGQTLTQWTIEFWIKPNSIGSHQGIFTKNEFWKEIEIGITPNGSLQFMQAWPNTYYNVFTSAGTITAGEWQHIGIVGDGVSISVYRNGVLAGSGTGAGQVSFLGSNGSGLLGNMSFGRSDYATLPDANFYSGGLADFRVWTRALSPAELLTNTTANPAANATGLANWIPFTELSGTAFADIVGTASGTLAGVTFINDKLRVPTLQIGQAVYLSSADLVIGRTYQIQVSTDLATWTNFGTPFVATSNTWQSANYWDASTEPKQFFRLNVLD